jgi:O-succinylbenzoic acid--CoA ligase
VTAPISTAWLTDAARSAGRSLALRDASGSELSYAELHARATALAGPLQACAPTRGLCLLELEPGLDHAVAMHAAMLAGRPFQSLRPGLPAAEREALLAAAGPAPVVDRAWLERPPRGAAFQPEPIEPERTLSRVQTSGTGGERRAVDLSYANHHASARASAANLGVEPDDVWLCCLPVDHVGGLTILIRSVLYGTAALVHDRFDPDRVAAALSAGVSLISLVPTQLHRLLEQGADLSGPRAVLVGGGPLPAALLDEALSRGVRVVQTYGLTEACSQVCTLSVADASRKRGSAGCPLPGIEVRIESGEILVRGPNVAAGAVAPDGWLHTGDLGRLDEEGYLWVEGRVDDLIVSGGENVRPEEVEAVLAEHPAVAEAAVFGRADPEWGQVVCAAVIPRPGSSPGAGELVGHCRRKLSPYKVPKAVVVVESLPRTASGKLQRRLLR